MMRLLLAVVLVLVANGAAAIAGGKPVVAGSAPWMTAIIDTSITPSSACLASGGSETFCQQVCGGVLIAPTWVLTAAHCLFGRETANLVTVSGVVDLNSASVAAARRVVLSSHRHPLAPVATRTVYRHDLLLLQLASPAGDAVASVARVADLETLSPSTVGIPDTPDPAADALDDEVQVYGWGRLGNTGGFPSRLQHVALDLMGPFCAAKYASLPDGFESSIWLCAGEPSAGEIEPDDAGDSDPRDTGGEDACVLDSGGPLVVRGEAGPQVIGIVSWGQEGDCGNPEYPTVYSRLPAYTDWIESATAAAGAPLGDLAVAVTGATAADVGGSRTITVRLSNAALSAAVTGAGFELTTDGGTLGVTLTPGFDCTAVTGGYRCVVQSASLPPGSFREASFQVSSADERLVTLRAVSFRGAGQGDYRRVNDNVTHGISFTAKPDIRVVVDGVVTEVTGASSGKLFVFVTVSNASTRVAASGVTVQVTLPEDHEAVDLDPRCTGVVVLSCTVGDLAAGSSKSFILYASSIIWDMTATGSLAVSAVAADGDFPMERDGQADATGTYAVSYSGTPDTGGGGGGGTGGGGTGGGGTGGGGTGGGTTTTGKSDSWWQGTVPAGVLLLLLPLLAARRRGLA